MSVTYKLGKLENGKVVEALGEWTFGERPAIGDHILLTHMARTDEYEVVRYTHRGVTPDFCESMPKFRNAVLNDISMQVRYVRMHLVEE